MNKRFLLIALCALFALNAEARTIYVNASRPNNSGNGRTARKAKKTLQAAINVSKKGDTIIVYPGTYAPIETKNRKIRIKSKSGAAKTAIRSNSDLASGAIARLGAANTRKKQSGGVLYLYVDPADSKGTKTSLSGFTVDGGNLQYSAGISGGTVKSCVVTGVCSQRAVCRSKLTGCTLTGNGRPEWSYYGEPDLFFGMYRSTLNRCKIQNNFGSDLHQDFADATWTTAYSASLSASESSKFVNCLITNNRHVALKSCTLVNCTVADNETFAMKSTKAFNTVFHKVPTGQFARGRKNKLKTCYRGNSPGFAGAKRWYSDKNSRERRTLGGSVAYLKGTDAGIISVSGSSDEEILAAAKFRLGEDALCSIIGYNRETGYYKGDYRLAKGSPCINKGRLSKSQKKLVGKKDLAGRKRIRGKSVDIGCYEY